MTDTKSPQQTVDLNKILHTFNNDPTHVDAHAIQNAIDSVNNTPLTKTSIQILDRAVALAQANGHPKLALKCAEQLLDAVRKRQLNTTIEYKVMLMTIDLMLQLQQLDDASKRCQQLQNLDNTNPLLNAERKLRLAHLAVLHNTPDAALQPLNQAIEQFEMAGNLPKALDALTLIGEVTCQLGQHDYAQTILQQAQKMAIESEDIVALIRTNHSLGSLYNQIGNTQKACEIYAQTPPLDKYDDPNLAFAIATLTLSYAQNLLIQFEISKAKALYDKLATPEISERFGPKFKASLALAISSFFEYNTDNTQAANTHLDAAETICRQHDLKQDLRNIQIERAARALRHDDPYTTIDLLQPIHTDSKDNNTDLTLELANILYHQAKWQTEPGNMACLPQMQQTAHNYEKHGHLHIAQLVNLTISRMQREIGITPLDHNTITDQLNQAIANENRETAVDIALYITERFSAKLEDIKAHQTLEKYKDIFDQCPNLSTLARLESHHCQILLRQQRLAQRQKQPNPIPIADEKIGLKIKKLHALGKHFPYRRLQATLYEAQQYALHGNLQQAQNHLTLAQKLTDDPRSTVRWQLEILENRLLIAAITNDPIQIQTHYRAYHTLCQQYQLQQRIDEIKQELDL